MITSSIPGTTRDVQEYSFIHKGKNIIICDTAGLKRKSKVKIGTIEGYALLRSYKTIRESQVVIYLLDATEGIVSLDQALLGEIISEGKSIILAVNKIDLWQDIENNMSHFIANLRQQLNFMPWLPVVFISAQEKQHIDILLNQVVDVYKERFIEISAEDCATLLSESKERNSQIDYMRSLLFIRSNPIIFKVITKKNKKLHFSHIRYLENRIREIYPCRGNPIFIDHLKK
jgi:GTP-binding protein